jgi:carbonic anhydrase
MTSTLKAAALAAATLAIAGFAPAHAADTPHWGYEGHGGAAHWAELDPAFKTCRLGKHQSPIDIDSHKVAKAPSAPPLAIHYASGPVTVVNNGHTVQVNLASPGTIMLGGTEYKLLQFHFHTPSEEKIDGRDYPLVAHLVHKSAQGQLAVIAVLFELGKENATLKPVFDQLPAKEGDSVKLTTDIDPTNLLPADRSHYSFAGSLTTPPCSEEVRWQVLKTPVEFSSAQFASFKKLYTMNARPVQPLNGRKVVIGH